MSDSIDEVFALGESLMRRPVLYVAVCAVLMCGFQSPSGDRKNPPRRSTTGSERARNRSLKDASTAAKKPAEVSDESSPLTKEALLEKLAKLNSEFNAQDQAMRMNPSQELFVELLQLKENILTIQAELHGATSSEVIEALEWLAEVTFRMKDLDRSEQYQQRLLDILKQKYGKTDYRVIDAQWLLNTTMFLLAMTPEQMKQFDNAQEQEKLAFESHQAVLYVQAVGFYQNAAQFYRITFGTEHPYYATTLNNIADLYRMMGRHHHAESLFRESLAIRKTVLGEQHPDYAICLNNLAVLYEAMGDFNLAEPLYQQTLETWKTTLGEQHPKYAICLNNLALLCDKMGEYNQAEQYYQQALAIWEPTLRGQDINYAICLNNLALLYDKMRQYTKAEQLYQESLAIIKNLRGEHHPDYATSLNNLAGVYRLMGEYALAEPLLRQSLGISKTTLGEQHPDYANSLNNLAMLYEAMREYAQAVSHYRQSLAIIKQVMGEQHPDYATFLNNLASLYNAMGEFAQAEPLFRQALQVQTANLQQLSVTQGEARSLVYQNALGDFHSLLACSRHLNIPDLTILYDAITESQGVISQVLIDRHTLVLDNPAALEKQQELRQLQRELATLVLTVPQPEQIEPRQQRLGQLNRQKEELEQELARLSEPFRRELEVQKTGLAELQRELNEQQALVHLIMGVGYNAETKESIPIIDAFIVRRDSLDWVQIPQGESLGILAFTWRAALINGDSEVAHQLGVKLREQLWQPIENKLQGVETLHFVLDGELSFLPYAALPGRKPGTILLEDYQLATVSHPRELYRQLTDESDSPQGPQFLAMGAVDYDGRSQPATPELLATTSFHRAPVVDRGATLFWNKLPGTGKEVERLTELWTEDDREQILIGPQASESELRGLIPGQAYIHLATHGFFADERFRSYLGHDQANEQLFSPEKFLGDNPLSGRGPTVTERNPLLLTGIVCAGANRPAETDDLGLPVGDDGIMTAQEIVNLDLRGTELVVLSACETGLGKVGGGEGVYGLQRAFQLAGARNVLGSLWSVDDAATAALMKLFYTKLWNEKLPPIEAIRQAQLEIYRDPGLIEKLTGQRAPLFKAEENLTRGDLKLNANANKQTSQRRTPARLWAAWTLQGSGI